MCCYVWYMIRVMKLVVFIQLFSHRNNQNYFLARMNRLNVCLKHTCTVYVLGTWNSRIPPTDIYFNITLRRKTVFYIVTLIIPCVVLEYLSIFVFFLPAYFWRERVALCISLSLSQTMFFLLISWIMLSQS